MICDNCQGTGGVNETDDQDDYCACWACDGKGTVPLRVWLGDQWYKTFGVRIGMLMEHLSYSKIGTRYWRAFGKARRARRLAEGKTALELHAIHGHRLNRLRLFADAIELDNVNIGHQYRVESRLVAEADLACKLKLTKTGEQ